VRTFFLWVVFKKKESRIIIDVALVIGRFHSTDRKAKLSHPSKFFIDGSAKVVFLFYFRGGLIN
jgi:hypothetical protein